MLSISNLTFNQMKYKILLTRNSKGLTFSFPNGLLGSSRHGSKEIRLVSGLRRLDIVTASYSPED